MAELTERGKQLRRDLYLLSKANGGYHYGGSFSCIEILITLFDKISVDPDSVVLSKGHSCWGLYTILREKGLRPLLEGHPHRDTQNGISWTTGSMGHGLPAALGIALARRLLKREKQTVYVIMGDGECQEGTTWESILLASKFELTNLCVIVDCNGIQGSGRVEDILAVERPLMHAASYAGWYTRGVTDGHDVEHLYKVITERPAAPSLIVAHTIKGCGVSFMEDDPKWHANWVDTDHEYNLLGELKSGGAE